jgi:hypothetical protein
VPDDDGDDEEDEDEDDGADDADEEGMMDVDGRRRRGNKGGGKGDGAGPSSSAAAFVKPRTLSEDPGELAGGDDAGDDASDGEWVDVDADLPSYEFRFECAKLLLELDDTTDAAVGVLERLVAEDDSVPDAWHLLGLAYYAGGELDAADEAAGRCGALLDARRKRRQQQQRKPAGRRRRGSGEGDEGEGEGDEEEDDGGVLASLEDLKAAIAEARGGGAGGDE